MIKPTGNEPTISGFPLLVQTASSEKIMYPEWTDLAAYS
jgi:hypothetical protein